LFTRLWEVINTAPATVTEVAPEIYKWVSARDEKQFFFDERDYFLGESALLAAGSHRLLGKREETERWLDRADANFRHTVAPAAHLARVSYTRLTLRYDTHRHDDLLELIPSVTLTFKKLGMLNDYAKCEFLQAMSLKEIGRVDEAATVFERLALSHQNSIDSGLVGMALVNLGGLRSEQGAFDKATLAYAQAAPLLQQAKRFSALADLKMMLGGTLQKTGQLTAAVEAFRESVNDHLALGMETRAAYIRLATAGALLEAQRPREAEWEIRAALPTIDEQGMAAEAVAAISILRESVQQRKTDPKALLEVREYLQAKN
jgi:tetratricopeptide (TPR) repeat protein